MTTKIYREAERRKLDYHDAWVELITQAEKALRLFVGRLEQHALPTLAWTPEEKTFLQFNRQMQFSLKHNFRLS